MFAMFANSTVLLCIFLYDDIVINDLCWNNQSKGDESMYAPITHLADRFASLVDQDVLKEGFEDYHITEDT